MTPLTPLDALGPAFRRMREVLAEPFRLGFFLKIALIAALTQPSFYSASLSYPIQGANFAFALGGHPGRSSGFVNPGHGSQFAASPGAAAVGLMVLAVMVVVGLAIWVVMSYLFCRLRFTLFDLVVYKRGRVGPAWSAYGRQSWRYFGMLLLASLGFLVAAALVIGPMLLNAIRVVKPLIVASRSSSHPTADPLRILGAMLPLGLAIFAAIVFWAVVDCVLQDFLLPPMAIEDASLESAFGRFLALLKADFGSLVLYILLRFAVGIGMLWMLMMAFILLLAIPALVIFGIGTVLYHALWSSIGGQVVCVALAILAGLVVIPIYLIGMIAIYGTTAVFKQSYAAYFFGGRYPELGQRLEPPPAAATELFPPPPISPPSGLAGVPPLSDATAVW